MMAAAGRDEVAEVRLMKGKDSAEKKRCIETLRDVDQVSTAIDELNKQRLEEADGGIF